MNTEQRDALRLHRVVGLVGTVPGTRVLDLAARVGVFTAGLEQLGADVVAVEGRQANIDQMPPVAARVIRDDVRNLATLDLGQFDVALCLGLLYHLHADDAVRLLATLAGMADQLILDTHISPRPAETTTVAGRTYRGSTHPDHDDPWGSIGNTTSWWFTDDSLLDVLRDAGWVGAERVYRDTPAYPDEPLDRAWYVAGH